MKKSSTGIELEYKVGTMIEIPRAALTADEIAEQAEFFSFGTNDLTQMTFDSQEMMLVSSYHHIMTKRSMKKIHLKHLIKKVLEN